MLASSQKLKNAIPAIISRTIVKPIAHRQEEFEDQNLNDELDRAWERIAAQVQPTGCVEWFLGPPENVKPPFYVLDGRKISVASNQSLIKLLGLPQNPDGTVNLPDWTGVVPFGRPGDQTVGNETEVTTGSGSSSITVKAAIPIVRGG